MRRRAKVDRNHAEVRDALRQIGWWVKDASKWGEGWPDLMIAKPGRYMFVEVKDGTRPPSERKLTPAQVRVHAELQAAGVPVVVVTSVEQAIRL
jgi:hypothetical protein